MLSDKLNMESSVNTGESQTIWNLPMLFTIFQNRLGDINLLLSSGEVNQDFYVWKYALTENMSPES